MIPRNHPCFLECCSYDCFCRHIFFCKDGSYDPIFASNYSLVHFLDNNLMRERQVSDIIVYWMKIEHVLFSYQSGQEILKTRIILPMMGLELATPQL